MWDGAERAKPNDRAEANGLLQEGQHCACFKHAASENGTEILLNTVSVLWSQTDQITYQKLLRVGMWRPSFQVLQKTSLGSMQLSRSVVILMRTIYHAM